MSDNSVNTEDKPKFVNLASRVKEADLIVYKEFCKGFTVQHEAFTSLLQGINNENKTIEVIKEVEKPLNENQLITEFTPALHAKLTALRRYLKKENKIPSESTKEEFTANFLEQAIKYYIKYNYDFINR
jgi:hypothetical protein